MRLTISAVLPTRARVAAMCAAALVATGIAIVNAGDANADDYPGQDQIAAARAAAENQAATVDQLDAAVATLEKAQSDAEAAQLLAADRYAQAAGDLDTAKANLVAARERADAADAALKEAQSQLAVVAQANYREGATMSEFGAVVTANGFEDAVTSSEFLARASDEMATIVQRVQAAQLVAQTLRTIADDAAVAAADAETAAADAYDTAEAAADAATQAVKEADAVRDQAVSHLAELQGTTVELEQQRQAGLKDARDQKRREAAKAAQEQAEKDTPKPPAETPDKPSTSDNPGSQEPSTPDKPGSQEPSTPDKPSTQDPAPEPEETEAPPPPPPPPATASGGWKSTAAQGETAVDKALTLMGLPYRLGGAGPTYYDCSGLTMTSWKAAGLSIQRSSQMQYNSLKHVAFSQLRKGDLIFYGTDRDPTQIYHVAIYIGSGQVAEATKPGSLSVVRAYDASWRIDDLIPVAGRP